MSITKLSDKDLENKFRKFLLDILERSESTVNNYCSCIKNICIKEKISLLELKKELKKKNNSFVSKYDKGGVEESYGKKGNGSVISALKKFSNLSNSL